MAKRLKPAVTVVFITFMVILWSTPSFRSLLQADVWASWLERANQDFVGIVALLVVMVALGVLFVPITAILLVGGFVWSWPYSFVLCQLMSFIVASILYHWGRSLSPDSKPVDQDNEYSQYLWRRYFEQFSDKIKATTQQIQRMNLGLSSLVVLRMLPISHFGVLSLCFGILRIPYSRYILATILGQSPATALWVLVGERARLGMQGFDVSILAVMLTLAAMPWLLIFAIRKMSRA